MTYTKEEQKKHRAELVKALRSGKYAQVRGCLRKDNRFCCLGVACDISGLYEWLKNKHLIHRKIDFWYYLGSTQVMPREVMDYYGFADSNGQYNLLKDIYATLTDMNDGGATFKEIADIIEKEPEGMFV